MCHTLTDSDFTRDQMLGESHQPLLFRKGKRLKEEVKRRQPPPDTPVVDVRVIAILLDEYMAEFILLYDFTRFQLYFSVIILSYVCVIGHSLPSSLNSSRGTLMTQGELCTHINWKA